MKKYYRPRIKNDKNIDFMKLIGYVSVEQETTKQKLVTIAITSFLEGALDDLVCAPQNPHPTFMLEDLKEELKNLREFMEREQK